MKQITWIVVGWMVLGFTTQAASFDCTKAVTKVEKLICGDVEISKLDEELDTAYREALKDEKQAYATKQAQKQWMKKRNRCTDATCVKGLYESRLQAINANEKSIEFGNGGMIASNSGQIDKTKTIEQVFPQAAPKLRYAFCDKNKPELYCEGQTGKGYTVCEAYLKYLQTLSSPPTCEAPIPPGFKQPDWEEMDVTQYLDLAYQAEGLFLKTFGGYKHPDVETWRKTFLQEIREGKINPRMRKAKVTPNDMGDVTILAYTRDRDSCRKIVEWETRRKVLKEQLPQYPIPHWTHQGDVHFTLWNERRFRLEIIGGDASRDQMELMIYAGRAYLVQVLEPLAPIYHGLGSNIRTANTSSITVFSFASQFPDRVQLYLKLDHYYAVNALCQFMPY